MLRATGFQATLWNDSWHIKHVVLVVFLKGFLLPGAKESDVHVRRLQASNATVDPAGFSPRHVMKVVGSRERRCLACLSQEMNSGEYVLLGGGVAGSTSQ